MINDISIPDRCRLLSDNFFLDIVILLDIISTSDDAELLIDEPTRINMMLK